MPSALGLLGTASDDAIRLPQPLALRATCRRLAALPQRTTKRSSAYRGSDEMTASP